MGAIKRGLANNITTGGVLLPSGINNTSLNNVTALPTGVGGKVLQASVAHGGAFTLSALNTPTRVGLELAITPISTNSTWHIWLLCNGFQADATGRGYFDAYLNTSSAQGNAGTLVASGVGAMYAGVSIPSTQALQSICISKSFASFSGTKYVDMVVSKGDTGTNTRFGQYGSISMTLFEVEA